MMSPMDAPALYEAVSGTQKFRQLRYHLGCLNVMSV